jgi:hypothetical protein
MLIIFNFCLDFFLKIHVEGYLIKNISKLSLAKNQKCDGLLKALNKT